MRVLRADRLAGLEALAEALLRMPSTAAMPSSLRSTIFRSLRAMDSCAFGPSPTLVMRLWYA